MKQFRYPAGFADLSRRLAHGHPAPVDDSMPDAQNPFLRAGARPCPASLLQPASGVVR